MTVSRTTQYARELYRCGLNQNELAFAMGWQVKEAQVFINTLKEKDREDAHNTEFNANRHVRAWARSQRRRANAAVGKDL